MWKVRMYMNTGFNTVNVPDSEATLNSAAESHTDFPVIDCLQRYFLGSIKIRAFEDDVIQGDYLKLWDDQNPNRFAFYVINGYSMSSGDTIELSITMDPLLTCGGVDNIEFLDGMTSRYNASNETMDMRNVEDDPLLIPQEIHIMPVGEYFGDDYDEYSQGGIHIGSSSALIVGSRYPVYNDGKIEVKSEVDVTLTADTYNGTINAVPEVVADWTGTYLDQYHGTKITDCYGERGASQITSSFATTDGNWYFCIPSDPNLVGVSGILKNCADLIRYGRQDVISSAYYVPRKLCKEGVSIYYANSSTKALSDIVINKSQKPELLFQDYFIYSVTNHAIGEENLLDFYNNEVLHHDTIHNRRAVMGKNFNFIFMLRDTGESVEVPAEQLSYVIYNNDKRIPKIRVNVDLRPSGHVEYGICDDTYEMGWTAPPSIVLKGSNWENANLTTSAASGAYLNAQKYELDQHLKEIQVNRELAYGLTKETYGNYKYLNPIKGLKQGNQSAMLEDFLAQRQIDLGTYGTPGMYSSRALNSPYDYSNTNEDMAGNPFAYAYFNRDVERAREKQEFVQANYPQVQVLSAGGKGSTLSTGHGMFLFRSMVSDQDVLRFDRILNQFGCKITVPTEKKQLKCRKLYNYIEASSVSIKCETVPRSVREDLASLFGGGLRIWHVDPKDHNYKEENEWVQPV